MVSGVEPWKITKITILQDSILLEKNKVQFNAWNEIRKHNSSPVSDIKIIYADN